MDQIERSQPKSDRRRGLELVAFAAGLMWLSEIVDAATGGDLDRFGIIPREVEGLDGILFAPFLHGGFGHLIANTVPFLAMGALIALSGLGRVAAVTVITAVVGGLGTWLLGSGNSLHIGASGLVFGYAGYLVSRFWYTRNLVHLAVGVGVLAIWGFTLLWGLVPREGMSWTGHAFGAIGGILAARLLDAGARERRDRRPGTPNVARSPL